MNDLLVEYARFIEALRKTAAQEGKNIMTRTELKDLSTAIKLVLVGTSLDEFLDSLNLHGVLINQGAQGYRIHLA